MRQEIWSVVSSLLELFWWVAPLLLSLLMWCTQVAPESVASNASKWATWIRMISGYMARPWGTGVVMVLMFVVGMGFENWRRPRAAQETVARCSDIDGWMAPLEAINALGPEGHDFYEAGQALKTLRQESIKLGYKIEVNPNSPELHAWQQRFSDIGRELNTAERTRNGLQHLVVLDLHEQLKHGTLVAKGHERNKDVMVCIPREYWHFLGLGLGDEELTASGQGIHYAVVNIRKAQ